MQLSWLDILAAAAAPLSAQVAAYTPCCCLGATRPPPLLHILFAAADIIYVGQARCCDGIRREATLPPAKRKRQQAFSPYSFLKVTEASIAA